jgi:hypothetical protein
MIAANFDITIDRATDWSIVLTIKDTYGVAINLETITSAGPPIVYKYDFTGEIRNKVTKKEVVSFTFDKTTNGDTGQLGISLSKANTLLLREQDTYEYDIFMADTAVNPDTFTRLLEGDCFVQNNTTR